MGNVNDPWKSSAKFLLSSFSLHFIAPGLLQACKKAPRYVSNVSAFPSFHYCLWCCFHYACIHWNHGAYISSKSYDKPAYSNVANSLVREYSDTPDFKSQRSYAPVDEDKSREVSTIERPTLRVEHYQPDPDQSASEGLIPAKRNKI